MSTGTALQIHWITQRLEKLENKVFKSNRVPATLAQQILILKHTGLLEQINFSSKTLTAKFISILLDEDEKNTNQYLNNLAKKDKKLINVKNYEFLVQTFESLELKKESKECQQILTKLLQES